MNTAGFLIPKDVRNQLRLLGTLMMGGKVQKSMNGNLKKTRHGSFNQRNSGFTRSDSSSKYSSRKPGKLETITYVRDDSESNASQFF